MLAAKSSDFAVEFLIGGNDRLMISKRIVSDRLCDSFLRQSHRHVIRYTMPFLSTLIRAVLPVFLAVFIYRFGLEDLTQRITDIGSLQWFASTTHCYASVKTLASAVPTADCFSISNGRFSRVYVDDSPQDLERLERLRTGHVIPGLWDGHGHLVQYGELLDSVNLFGADSMQEVQERLLQYKISRPDAGTKERWLRGVGWDQTHFNGQWPNSVCFP